MTVSNRNFSFMFSSLSFMFSSANAHTSHASGCESIRDVCLGTHRLPGLHRPQFEPSHAFGCEKVSEQACLRRSTEPQCL